MSSLRFERWYPHSPEDVWHALTDRDLLASWLMPNDIEPRIGHRFTFRTEPAPGFDGIVHCEVLELDRPRLLAFSWRGGPIDTVVRFRLAAERGGTRMLMEQTGFRGLRAWLVSRILKSGLPTIYGKRLPAALAGIRTPVTSAGSPPECMSNSQGLIQRILGFLSGAKS
jgi:uncharacterized protein YndB with AHSA1/START domain